MSSFVDAGPAEIVRSAQKDEYFVRKLRSDVNTLVQKVKGIKWWIYWHKELDLLSDTLYFILTTFIGNQTLGEEYVNVIQVDNSLRRRRACMIFLHAYGPYTVDRWAARTKRYLDQNPQCLSGLPNLRSRLIDSLPRLSSIISIAHQCHLLLFYFQAKYYHLAKRQTGIRYVLIRPWLKDETSRWAYYFLGCSSLIQLLLSLMLYINSYMTNERAKSRFQSEGNILKPGLPSANERNCPLCLEMLQDPTASICGHIFCWSCIIRTLEVKSQCPLCGEQFEPSRLIPLRNY
ncbi:peroxisome bioproteinsis factor 10 [Chamberlinius hualienensis]